VKKAKEEIAYEEEQKRLHKKYIGVDENKEIIEKSNYMKAIVSSIIVWLIIIILAFLVFCGACSLVFEDPRNALITIFKTAINYIAGRGQ